MQLMISSISFSALSSLYLMNALALLVGFIWPVKSYERFRWKFGPEKVDEVLEYYDSDE